MARCKGKRGYMCAHVYFFCLSIYLFNNKNAKFLQADIVRQRNKETKIDPAEKCGRHFVADE